MAERENLAEIQSGGRATMANRHLPSALSEVFGKTPPLDWLAFKLFRVLPRYLVVELEERFKGWHVVGFRRGSSIELEGLPHGSCVVPVPELGGWVVMFSIVQAHLPRPRL